MSMVRSPALFPGCGAQSFEVAPKAPALCASHAAPGFAPPAQVPPRVPSLAVPSPRQTGQGRPTSSPRKMLAVIQRELAAARLRVDAPSDAGPQTIDEARRYAARRERDRCAEEVAGRAAERGASRAARAAIEREAEPLLRRPGLAVRDSRPAEIGAGFRPDAKEHRHRRTAFRRRRRSQRRRRRGRRRRVRRMRSGRVSFVPERGRGDEDDRHGSGDRRAASNTSAHGAATVDVVSRRVNSRVGRTHH